MTGQPEGRTKLHKASPIAEGSQRKGPEGLRAAERAMQILFTLAAHSPGMTLSDLARETGLSLTTAHRMTTTLRTQGLTRETTDGLQALGPRVLVLARGFLGGLDFRVEALPVLSELREATGETCHLGTLAAPHIVYVDKLDGIHPVQVASRIGGTQPAVSTALGRAILAYSDPQVVAGVIAATERQLGLDVDADALDRVLAVTRARGYGIDVGENLPGVCCVGAPVFTDTGTVIAGISVSIPTERFDREAVPELGRRVRAAADRISAALGLELLPGARPGHDEEDEE